MRSRDYVRGSMFEKCIVDRKSFLHSQSGSSKFEATYHTKLYCVNFDAVPIRGNDNRHMYSVETCDMIQEVYNT